MGNQASIEATLALQALGKSNTRKSLAESLLVKKFLTESSTPDNVTNALEELSSNRAAEMTVISEDEVDFWGAEHVDEPQDQEIEIKIAIKGGKVSVDG